MDAVELVQRKGAPVLVADTCILLDILRAPIDLYPRVVASALWVRDSIRDGTLVVLTPTIVREEFTRLVKDRSSEAESELKRLRRSTAWFELNGSLLSLHPGRRTQFAGYDGKDRLVAGLVTLATGILGESVAVEPNQGIERRALHRSLNRLRPAQRGRGVEDCVIVETALELGAMLDRQNGAHSMCFASSNRRDFCAGHGGLHPDLAGDFERVGLSFAQTLPQVRGYLAH